MPPRNRTAKATQAATAGLRILATSDLHNHIHAFSYEQDRPDQGVGLARTASLIAVACREASSTILLDNGDTLQGTALADYLSDTGYPAAGEIHPMIAAMNALGYDAAAPGNHDFNYGIDFLARAYGAASFPFTCANIAFTTPKAPPISAFEILPRTIALDEGGDAKLRIGIFGVVPPQIVKWDRHHLSDRVAAEDILPAARRVVPLMQEAGADIILALCHSGIGKDADLPGIENAAVPLAAIEGIDALITGHTHQVFPGPGISAGPGIDPLAGTLHGRPAVMPGSRGSHLGIIDLALERRNGGWRVRSSRSEVRAIAAHDPDGESRALVADDERTIAATAKAHKATRAHVGAEIGTLSGGLDSYFSLVSNCPSVQLVARAQAWFLAREMPGATRGGLPILSAAAPFKAGGAGRPEHFCHWSPGPVQLRHVSDLYSYPNTLVALKTDGAGLRDWLERSAGLYRRLAPGGIGQPLLRPDFPAYNFDSILGVTWRIDPTRPARFDLNGDLTSPSSGRVTDLHHDGKPIREDMTFIVATNSYRAGGGGCFRAAETAPVVFSSSRTIREILIDYIRHHETIVPRAEAAWSFAAHPGTTAEFETSREALCRTWPTNVRPAGDPEGGFQRFRLAL